MKQENSRNRNLSGAESTKRFFGLVAVLVFGLSLPTLAQTRSIRIEGKTYDYIPTSSLERKYFTNLLGWTHTYVSKGPGIPESSAARREISRVFLPDYYNYRMVSAKVDNLVKLKRGYCVPCVLTASGEEAVGAYALDFFTKNGAITSFVVGAALNCSRMPKAK